MSTATMQQAPVVPPRPSRNQDKDDHSHSSSLPKVPPRPIKNRNDRSLSPSNPERFAPSPLNESPFLSRSPKATRFSPANGNGFSSDPIERSGSVAMPSVGEEGAEYEVVKEERASPPEHTRTVGDLHLHAPKPSLPAQSAKERVAAVTRTDSDRAAAFGIGRPSSEEPGASKSGVKKKASTGQISGSDSHFDDEQGIPEIGLRVPMNPFAGDIQAPSPAPVSGISEGLKSGRHHGRKTSARGFVDLPPGSYGLHGHGVASSDKLGKAYYEKHPEARQREQSTPLHDRQNDFAMSSTELNKIVRETASRGSGLGKCYHLRGE
jgi:Altered inheritance of mitochondria protein 21